VVVFPGLAIIWDSEGIFFDHFSCYNPGMEEKLEKTVVKTLEALARIERFVVKYGPDLKKVQKDRIAIKIQELQNKIQDLY
jgi:hypothetical protein